MTPTEELKIAEPQSPSALPEKSGKFNFLAEVTALEQTEAVIAGIEEIQLEIQPRNFPTANLQKKIADLREALMETVVSPERVRQTEVRLRQELGLWRMALAKRDDNFSAFDLRGFCENTEPPIENEFFLSLAKFYRNMPPTAAVLSKFDYVITQYFSRKRDKNRRALRLEADKIVQELRELNHEWTDGASSVAPFSQTQIRESVTALAQLSANAKSHKTLKNWLDNEFFNYTRAVKRRLSETFFVPEVTTAVVVCNLVVGNHFAALCETDSDKLNETAAMFAADEFAQQNVANHLNQAFQALLHFSLEESSAEAIARQRLTNLVSLTFEDGDFVEVTSLPEKAVVQDDISTQVAAPVTEQKQFVEEFEQNSEMLITAAPEPQTEPVVLTDEILDSEFITETPQVIESQPEAAAFENASELEAVVETLAKHNPNIQLIKEYLQKSPLHEIRTLNLAVFLPELSDVVGRTDDRTLRRALGIIIRSQDLTQFIEKGEGELNPDLLDEVNLLRDEIQAVNQLLRNSMRGMAGATGEKERENFENLLYVTNTLVEAQLRINTSIVRRQPTGEEVTVVDEVKELKYEKIKVDAPLFQPKFVAAKSPRVNPMLLVFAVLVVLIAGGLFFLDYSGADTRASAGSFKKIEVSQLKAGSVLAGAKINKESLYAFPNDAWQKLDANQKKETLRSIVSQGVQFGFKKVIVVDRDGQVVATAWEGEVNLVNG
jgi:hypothetical protein